MANLSKEIQCAGSDTRPPMLDRTDFASWQQRIQMYCRSKENGLNILKSIDEGPFQMGIFRETLAEGTEGGSHLGPEQPRVYSDLSPEEKDRMFRVDRIEDMGIMHEVQVHLVMGELKTELGMLIQVKQGRLSAKIALENGVALDEEQLLFIAGGQDNVVNEAVDEQPIQDLALNVDNVFQANDYHVYDKSGPSYDSDVLSEIHDHDHYKDVVCEHHE
nr:integrase, catalytic region, zinc finger, CCHC-type, peptidase aspartic, catalytic [Tanacetum cinerariifolium]